jgi:hypothetical protein
MGINIHGVRLLCYAKHMGANFERTATIGRQGMSLSKREMARVLDNFGYGTGDAGLDTIMTGTDGYAEALLAHLGANEIHSFDCSAYEGATHVHDMNDPIPDTYKEAYSVVIDGGTLEHVFNYPTAIRNCMEMLRVGGHFLTITPANNFFGHGFYQFSPELFYSVFSGQNGFELKRLIAFNDRPNKSWRSAHPNARWYAVTNPADIGERVTLSNSHPVSLIVIARKVSRVPLFKSTPHQSDYVTIWQERAAEKAGRDAHSEGKPDPRPLWVRLAKVLIPAPVRFGVRKTLNRPRKPLATRFERRFFQPLDPTAEVRRY